MWRWCVIALPVAWRVAQEELGKILCEKVSDFRILGSFHSACSLDRRFYCRTQKGSNLLLQPAWNPQWRWAWPNSRKST